MFFFAIATVHAASVVHYDIKSLNYLVKRDKLYDGMFHAVLTDFGICKILDEATTVQGMSFNAVTGRTPAFTPPETFNLVSVPSALWPARDVYAGSIILNELLTREAAWHARPTNIDIKSLVLAGERPPSTPTPQLIGQPTVTAFL